MLKGRGGRRTPPPSAVKPFVAVCLNDPRVVDRHKSILTKLFVIDGIKQVSLRINVCRMTRDVGVADPHVLNNVALSGCLP